MMNHLLKEKEEHDEKTSRHVLDVRCCCDCDYPVHFISQALGGGHMCSYSGMRVATAFCYPEGVELGHGKHPCKRCAALLAAQNGGGGERMVVVADKNSSSSSASSDGSGNTNDKNTSNKKDEGGRKEDEEGKEERRRR